MKDVSSQLLVTKNKGQVTISLNRPPANSYYYGFLKQLSNLIGELSRDDKIKVVLIKSTSEKFFCAGADIKIFSANTQEQNLQMVQAAREVSASITESNKIFVATISGHVLGGGLELAMACDIRLAADSNYFVGLPEVKLGLMPGNGGTPRLIDLIGVSRAMELLVTGNTINARTAYQYGLFNQLYPVSEFEEKVEEYMLTLAKGAGSAMAAIKKYVLNHKGTNLQQALLHETESVNALYNTPDAKEGFLAFVEKRDPEFL